MEPTSPESESQENKPPFPVPGKSLFDIISESRQNYKDSEKKEDLDLAEQELRHKFRDGERGEKYKKHFHNLMVMAIYSIGSLLILIIIVRVWHLIAPEGKQWGYYWVWLSERQQDDLERLIFSGIILGFATRYFKYYKIFGSDHKGDSH